MENQSIFNECTNLYSLSKTLRFELVPVGIVPKGNSENEFEIKTLNELGENDQQIKDNITKLLSDNIEKDEIKYAAYNVVKIIFDKYHEEYIKYSLKKVKINNWGELKKLKEEYIAQDKEKKSKNNQDKNPIELYSSNDGENEITKLEKITKLESDIRNEIIGYFITDKQYLQPSKIKKNKEEKNSSTDNKVQDNENEDTDNKEKKLWKFIKYTWFSNKSKDELDKIFIEKNNKSIIENYKQKIEAKKLPLLQKDKERLYLELEAATEKNEKKRLTKEIKKKEEEYYNYNFNKEENIKTIKEILITALDEFKGFEGYFNEYYKNRENYYSHKKKSTSITNRIVNENFQKFLKNIEIFEKAKSKNLDFSDVYNSFRNELQAAGFNLIEDIFKPEVYNNFINQDGIDLFHLIIGGCTNEDTEIKIGVNNVINKFNQDQNDNNDKIPTLKKLFKQIGATKNSSSFVLEPIQKNNEIVVNINNFYTLLEKENLLEKLETLLSNDKTFNTPNNNIYINETTLTKLSEQIFGLGKWNVIYNALYFYIEYVENDSKYFTKQNKKPKDGGSLAIKWLKDKKKIPLKLSYLEDVINNYLINYNGDDSILIKMKNSKNVISYWFKSFKFNIKLKNENNENQIFKTIDILMEIKKDIDHPIKLIENIDESIKIDLKQRLDNLLSLQHFLSPLAIGFSKNKNNDKTDYNLLKENSDFYTEFDELYEEVQKIIPLYNQIRNFVTKKPYSLDKFKLNFENPTLAKGWDDNKQHDNTTTILFSKNKLEYFLVVFNKENIKKNDYEKYFLNTNKNNFDFYNLHYKFIGDSTKSLPKAFFSKKGKAIYLPSNEVLEIYNNRKNILGAELTPLINFYKDSLKRHPSWGKNNFTFNLKNTYENIDDFYKDITMQGYKIEVDKYKIDNSTLYDLIRSNKIFLFKIKNKDFNERKLENMGKKRNFNIHTMIWNLVFDKELNKNFNIKLDGEASLFYREKSIPFKITHPKLLPIKNDRPINNKVESTFLYDLIKDKRFTENKYFFYVPISINRIPKIDINNDAINLLKLKPVDKYNHLLNIKLRNEKLKDNINIIGIDRGEKNLLYYSVINQQGLILEQGDLNTFNNFNYRDKLDELEKNRNVARESWQSIQKIKDLKKGYISHAVHFITKLIIKHNAIVVMENLNWGFKTGRMKYEKQVYGNFEKALIIKLNYLFFKYPESQEPCINNALQLTPLFGNNQISLKDLDRQLGIIFYIDARNTSRIDPTTGFINKLHPKNSWKLENVRENIKDNELTKKQFVEKFISIDYNSIEDTFEFKFKYSNFIKNTELPYKNEEFILIMNDEERCYYDSNVSNNKEYNKPIKLASKFKELLSNEYINITKEKILQNDEWVNCTIKYLVILLNMRYSYSGRDIIISPIKNNKGIIFKTDTNNIQLPKDADANGAYNIAIKGLCILDKILNKETELYVDEATFIKKILALNKTTNG